MSAIEEIGKLVGSRRYARDLMDFRVETYPWWEIPPKDKLIASIVLAKFAHQSINKRNAPIAESIEAKE